MRKNVKFYLCLLIFLFLYSYDTFIFAASNWRQTCQESQCYAIVDAGSSGSRFYIYSKDYQVLYSHQVQPGLSSIQFDEIPEYLNQLMPHADLSSIPTYFYGTAGMRLLTESAQSKRYQLVYQWFDSHPSWNLLEARTILGKEEGVYAWLAVNQYQTNQKAVLEIGGASYQVNIPVDEDFAKSLPQEDISVINLKGEKINVWTKSYLGLGINEVEKNVNNEGFCFSQNYQLKNGLLADGDISQCIQSLEKNPELALLNRFSEAKTVLNHHTEIDWVALGAIRYSVSTPPYQFFNHEFNLKGLRQQADQLTCHENWNALIQKFADPFMYRQCLAASFFYASMVDAIGIDENQLIRYPEDNQGLDWTLGALLFNQTKV